MQKKAQETLLFFEGFILIRQLSFMIFKALLINRLFSEFFINTLVAFKKMRLVVPFYGESAIIARSDWLTVK